MDAYNSRFLDNQSGAVDVQPYGLLETLLPLFQHIGEMDRDDIYAVAPLLTHAVMHGCV
jgi:hypothetical protein